MSDQNIILSKRKEASPSASAMNVARSVAAPASAASAPPLYQHCRMKTFHLSDRKRFVTAKRNSKMKYCITKDK